MKDVGQVAWRRSSEDTHVSAALREARTISQKIPLTVCQDSVDGPVVLMTKSMLSSGITSKYVIFQFQTKPEASGGVDLETSTIKGILNGH